MDTLEQSKRSSLLKMPMDLDNFVWLDFFKKNSCAIREMHGWSFFVASGSGVLAVSL